MALLQNALCWNFVFVTFTKLKQIPSRICDFRLLLLASRKPSSEHPKSQILVVGSIVFEHLFDLSGSTLVLDLLRAWLHACSTPGPKLPQADPKPTFQERNSSTKRFVKLYVLCAHTISNRISLSPKKNVVKKMLRRCFA